MISQCELEPSFSGRVWVMGGAGLLDIPYTDLIGNHLPGSHLSIEITTGISKGRNGPGSIGP